MNYDPVKNIFASLIKKLPFLRIIFYKILDLMFLRSWYVRRELRKFRKIFGNKKINIYDAGSGYGQYSFFMSKALQPCEIYSVDVKEDWINDCRDFFTSQNISNVTFGVEDLTKIEHSDRFDLIVCVDVMEHIPDDIKVFQNYANALKKDGYLLINTPSIYGGSEVHDENDESFVGEHARNGYSREDFESKLHPLGFTTVQSKYTYGFWGNLAWRFGIKYPILMVNFSKLLLLILPLYYLITFPFTFLMMLIDFNSNNKVGSGINFIAKK
jgi:SAM-dependent methyltransferase